MSARDHKPSRRALLGAAVAMPFVPLSRHCDARGAGLLPPGQARGRNDGEWREALVALRTAEDELRAFEERTAGAPDEAQEAVELEMDERLDVLGPALLRLLAAPAPDLAALVVKIETIIAHEAWSTSGSEDCLEELCRDARRLARG